MICRHLATKRNFSIGLIFTLIRNGCVRKNITDSGCRQNYARLLRRMEFLWACQSLNLCRVVLQERDSPPAAFGSEEDSLGSYYGSLMPGPPPGENKNLISSLAFPVARMM